MGLDITAYTKLRWETAVPVEVAPYVANYLDHTVAFLPLAQDINGDFPGRDAGLEVNVLYSFPFDSRLRFRAGSYSGYGEWRRILSSLVEDEPDAPFYELIHFSDCEGIIGPVVSKKLAQDFDDFADKLVNHDIWWLELYAKWRAAFKLAADGGAVQFH